MQAWAGQRELQLQLERPQEAPGSQGVFQASTSNSLWPSQPKRARESGKFSPLLLQGRGGWTAGTQLRTDLQLTTGSLRQGNFFSPVVKGVLFQKI